jgi:hypothetical protein
LNSNGIPRFLDFFSRGTGSSNPSPSSSESGANLQTPLAVATSRAGVVEIAARCPAGANRSNHLVAHLDGDACAKRQWVRRYRYRLRPFNEVVPWEVKRICRRRFIGIPFDLCAA